MRKLIILLFLPLVIFFSVFLLGGAPFVLNIVKQKIVSSAHTYLKAPVEIGSIRGNLFYSLEMTDIKIGKAAELRNIRTSYNLMKLFSKEIAVSHLALEGFVVHLNEAESLIATIAVPGGDKKEGQGQGFSLLVDDFTLTDSRVLGYVSDQEIDMALETAGRLRPQTLVIDTFILTKNSSVIAVSGQVPLDDEGILDMTYRLHLLLDEFNLEGISGAVESSGGVSGQKAAPLFLSETELDITYNDDNLSGKISARWQTPDLNNLTLNTALDIRTRSLQENKKKYDIWHVNIDAQGRDLSGQISSVHGSFGFTGNMGGDIQAPALDIDFTGAFRFDQFKPQVKGNLKYQNDTLVLTKCQIRSRALFAVCNAEIITDEIQKINADLSVTCDNIALINTFLISPQPVSGRVMLTARAKGTLREPDVTGSIALQEVEIFEEKITDGIFKVAYMNSSVYLDSGMVTSPRGMLALNGMFRMTDNMFKIHAKSDGITLRSPEVFGRDTIPLSGEISFIVDLQGNIFSPAGQGSLFLRDIVYDTLGLGDYDLTAAIKDGAIDLHLQDKDMTLELATVVNVHEPLSFAGQLNLKHFDLTKYTDANDAYITAMISAQGNTSALDDLTASVRIDTIFAALPQGRVRNVGDMDIVFEKGIININKCILNVHDQNIAVQGQIPLDIETGAVDIMIQTPEIEIADLASFIPDAPDLRGLVSADISVKGLIKAPQINGKLVLEKAAYSSPGLAVDSVYGRFIFYNNRIDIEQVMGKLNSGIFQINGYAEVSKNGIDDAAIILAAEKIDISNKDYGTVIISSALRASAKKDSIKITGEISLDKAVYDVPLNHQLIIKMLTRVNQPPPEQADFFKKVFCDVGVSAPRGLLVKNNIADVAADLDLQIKGYLSKVNIYGTIATSRKGTVKYLGKKFDITDAQIHFDNPYEINPVIDLNAVNYISSEDGDYEVFLHVSGTAKEWRLELTSSPPLPEQDIISLLVIGRRRPGMQLTKGGKGLDLKGAAKDYAAGVALKTIEKTAEQKLGIEKLTITGDLLKPRELDISIEKRFAQKFTFIYGTGLESWELHRIGVNYDITDNMSIFTLHDQESLNSSVDLNIHFRLR